MEDSLHRLIKGLNPKEQKAILQRIGKRSNPSHQARIFRAMNKENSWSKSRNRKLAETLDVSTRQLAVEKNSLYRRILHFLRREDTTAYAIKGIYEELHHFFMLRDRGLIPLGLKSLRRAKTLAQQSDHQELLAFILYQEMFILRKHRTNEISGSLDEVASEYKTLTENLEQNFHLVRGFNAYFSEANRYNPNVKDPEFLEFIQRYAQPFENNPRAEYDRLVFFNRLWSKHAELVPFDIVNTAVFYESTPLASNEMEFNLYIEYIGMIDKYVIRMEFDKAKKMLDEFEAKNRTNPFAPDIYQWFASSRFIFYLNNMSKEEILTRIPSWERELRNSVLQVNVSLVQYANFVNFYLLANHWEKLLRWADDFEFYFAQSFTVHKLLRIKVQLHKLIAYKELCEEEKSKSLMKNLKTIFRLYDLPIDGSIYSLSVKISQINIYDKSSLVSICAQIMNLFDEAKDLARFMEIYIWVSSKISKRTTYDEFYYLKSK